MKAGFFLKTPAGCFVFLILTVAARADVPLPVIPNQYFNVTDYGAVGDGATDDTTAIQDTINAASAAGGGVVEIPVGTYLSGPLTLKSSINLQIDTDATLEMLPYGTYPGGSSPTDFISASKLHDIEISGSGTVDGQGAAWWSAYRASGIARPKAMFAPSGCTNIFVRDVTLQNPPNTHISFRHVCINVTVDHININTPNNTPNTDGIDCSAANVLIENSHISDGDDMIAMGDGHTGNFNHDIAITNCLFGTGHGVSIGSYTEGGLSNLLVINCVWTNGTSGFHLKSDDGRGGLVQGIRLINLSMTNTQIPIFLYSYYTNSGTSHGVSVDQAAAYPIQPVVSTTPIWRDIIISNFTAVAASGYSAGIIWGKPELSFSNVIMDHVNITATKYFQLYNAQGVQLIDSQIMVPSTNAFALYNADLIISNQTPSPMLVKLEGVSTNGLSNALRLYNSQATLSRTNMLAANRGLTVSSSTLTVSNNLTLSSSNLIDFVLGANAATIAVKGNLTLGGTINLSAGAGFTVGTYTLLMYTGALNGNLPALGAVPAGYLYSFDTNTSGQVKLVVAAAAPPAPTNLLATPGNLEIRLKWNAVGSATSYRLKRGTASGIYPTVFSGLTATNYTDAAVTNSVTYYYVVSAMSSGNESTNSPEVAAAPLPSNVPTNITVQVVGGQLQLTWPRDHLGWHLQVQTNDPGDGLGTNWVTVPDSQVTNWLSMPIDSTKGSVFLRLAFP